MMEERVYNNRYRIERRLGDGGTAIVYAGMDGLLRRRVAIKVLREQFARDDDFVKRFYIEAENAAKLSHPNIVNIYDVGRQDNEYFIVMELVDGETLSSLIAADGKIPEPVAIDYATQITSGLAYAHRQGLLHRDIKPANILITKDDVVKLSDFGIARAVSQHTMGMTQAGMVMGTVYYLSPEQAQGHDVRETSDLYSLGVVLYQMVVGKLPYTGESPITVALKHVSEPVPALEPEVLGISPALASIITKLLQKNPADRFASANDVASALRDARERPTVLQGSLSRGAEMADAQTVMIPKVTAPPPRRSQAPDPGPRRSAPTNGSAVVVDETPPAPAANPARYAILAFLLMAAIAVGYILFGRHGAFTAAKTVVVQNYGGTSATKAQDAIVAAGLTPKITTVPDTKVLQGRVVRQNPAPGSKLASNGVVELFVSSGLPFATVPKVAGTPGDAAVKRLEALRLKVNVDQQFSSKVKAGVVMRQNPSSGTKLRMGSAVTLVVSRGVQTVAVPDIVSATVAQATSTLANLKLKLNVTARQPSDAIPADEIITQDPKPGSNLNAGGAVSVTVSSGIASVTAPGLGGKNATDATSVLSAAGLSPSFTYSVQPNDATGTVIRQDPAPGSKVKRGTAVTITIGVAGVVPDVSGMSLADAKAALQNAGYAVGNTTETQEGTEGKVVRTEPEANTQLQPGEAVTIYFNGQVSGSQ